MNEQLGPPPADINTADIVAFILAFVMMVMYGVGAATSNTALMLGAGVVGLPAAVLKVRSSRAKSRWWHRYDELHRAERPRDP